MEWGFGFIIGALMLIVYDTIKIAIMIKLMTGKIRKDKIRAMLEKEITTEIDE